MMQGLDPLGGYLEAVKVLYRGEHGVREGSNKPLQASLFNQRGSKSDFLRVLGAAEGVRERKVHPRFVPYLYDVVVDCSLQPELAGAGSKDRVL